MSWIDDFTDVLGQATEVIETVGSVLGGNKASEPVTPKQAAEETAKPTQAEGSNTLPSNHTLGTVAVVALLALGLFVLVEVA